MNYIYLLKEREFVNLKKSIYKIGKTTQNNLTRVSQYPKRSCLLLQIKCVDCSIMEKNLIDKFKDNFIQCIEIGREYFEGDENKMIKIILNEIANDLNDTKIADEITIKSDSQNDTCIDVEKPFSDIYCDLC